MKRINEVKLYRIITQAINEAVVMKGGNVDHFTPYSEKEKEANFKAIGHVGNPVYDAFKRWRDERIARGIPARESSWAAYQKEKEENRK